MTFKLKIKCCIGKLCGIQEFNFYVGKKVFKGGTVGIANSKRKTRSLTITAFVSESLASSFLFAILIRTGSSLVRYALAAYSMCKISSLGCWPLIRKRLDGYKWCHMGAQSSNANSLQTLWTVCLRVCHQAKLTCKYFRYCWPPSGVYKIYIGNISDYNFRKYSKSDII